MKTLKEAQKKFQELSERLTALSTKVNGAYATVRTLELKDQVKLLKAGGAIVTVTGLLNWVGAAMEDLQPAPEGSGRFADVAPFVLERFKAEGIKVEAVLQSTRELLAIHFRTVEDMLARTEK